MERYLVEGAIAVKAVMLNQKRPVYEILIAANKQSRDISFIKQQASKRGIQYTITPRETIDAMAVGKTHGGVVALVGNREYDTLRFTDLQGFVVLLQGIEDPFNFGYCLRSLYAAGCDGVIVFSRNWLTAADTVVKSSAGASEMIPIYQYYEGMLAEFKNHGYQCVASQRSPQAIPLSNYQPPKKILLAFGGEKRGLSADILQQMEGLVYIDYNRDYKMALNGSSAVSVMAFNIINKQRKAELCDL